MFKTHFSFRKATGSPEELVERLAELGYEYAPLSDINNTFAFVRWNEACKKHGLKPVFGVSLHVTPMIEARKPVTDLFTFYAIDTVQPLNDLVRKAYDQGRSLPRLGFTPLIKYSDLENLDGLIAVSGYRAQLDFMNPEQENLFVGLSPSCAKGFIKKAIDNGFKFFARQEPSFVNPDDRDFYQISCSYDADLRTWKQSIGTDKDWLDNISLQQITNTSEQIEQALENRNQIFDKCSATLGLASLPEVKSEKTLEEICRDGAKELIEDWTQEYEDRLQTELKVIREKEIEDYFLLVGDLMRWARKRMAVGPGRGSSSGSLACYLCGITRVNPIETRLLFFRFLDPARKDAADIDLDLADAEACLEYLSAKYGYDHVAKLGATGSFQAAGATNDVAKQLKLPRFEFDKLLDSLPKYSAGDAREDKKLAVALEETPIGQKILDKYPEFKFAGQLSGNPSHATTHAAGVIITKEPLSCYTAVDTRRKTAMVDLKDAEKLNLLKLDCLSLDTLTLFQKTLELSGLTLEFLDEIPLDDQAAFDILNDGKTVGLFQLEGGTAKNLASKVKVTELNDIVVISSMARPGPLQSGGAERWVNRRIGKEPVQYAHEIFEPYLKDTLGEFAFQEQIMLIAHDLGGLDWGSVNKLRKAIGKSLGPEAMREYGEPFKAGLISKGVPQEVADKFWNDVLGCGSYLFSKNHAYPYGLMSYYSCYLKAHYPLEFMAAALTLTGSADKQIALLREAAKEGVPFVAFDPELSIDRWQVVNTESGKKLIGPLQNAIGLGPKAVSEIMDNRLRDTPISNATMKKLQNAKTSIGSLYPIREAILNMNWKAATNGKRVTRLDEAKSGPEGTWLEYTILGLVSEVIDVDENDQKKQEDRKARGQQVVMEGNARAWGIRLDSDEVKGFYCKVTAKKYDDFKDVVLTLKPKSSIVAMDVSMVPNVPCGIIKRIEVIGEIDE